MGCGGSKVASTNQKQDKTLLDAPKDKQQSLASSMPAAEEPASKRSRTERKSALVELPACLGEARGAKSRTKLGEGAIWDPIVNKLRWIDIIKGKIFTYDYEGDKTQSFCDLRQTLGTVVPHSETTVVVATIKGAAIVDVKTGKAVRSLGLPDMEKDAVENRLNDGKCDPQGRLWVGSMSVWCEGNVGNLYSLDADGKWEKRVGETVISNGLVWSKDKSTFWYIDTPTGQVDAFDYDETTGAVSNRRCAIKCEHGFPDGCTIDSEDKIWIAMWSGGCVCRYDPATGILLSKHTVPHASQVTSCAFGGEKLDQLFITTASCGLTEEQLAGEECNAGALFRLDLSADGVKGVPAVAYAGK